MLSCCTACPLYPRKRTSESRTAMSALGQNWTHAPQQTARLFDHFVGATEQRRWEGQTECLGRLQVDDECNFCHLLNWQVGRSGALENLSGVDAALAVHVDQIGSVAHQAACSDEVAYAIDRWHRVAGRQGDDLAAIISEKPVDADGERAGAQLDKSPKRCVDLAFG